MHDHIVDLQNKPSGKIKCISKHYKPVVLQIASFNMLMCLWRNYMKVCRVFGKTEKDIASHSTELWWIWQLNVAGINRTVPCSHYKSSTAVCYTQDICTVMLYIKYDKFSVQHIKQMPNVSISTLQPTANLKLFTLLLNQRVPPNKSLCRCHINNCTIIHLHVHHIRKVEIHHKFIQVD